MEEEKKEMCCETKKHHHGCCGHKVARAILLALAIFAIFSLGVYAGSCRNFDREIRGGRNFNFEQQGSGRMMRGDNFEGQQNNNGGCRFQDDDSKANSGCQMKNDTATTGATGCPMQNKNIVPATPLTPAK